LLAGTDGETRVVTQSSGAHTTGEVDFDDLHHEDSYGKWEAYGQSKLANLLFAYELQRQLEGAGVTDVKSVACHPGYAATAEDVEGGACYGPGGLMKRPSPLGSVVGADVLFALETSRVGLDPGVLDGTRPERPDAVGHLLVGETAVFKLVAGVRDRRLVGEHPRVQRPAD